MPTDLLRQGATAIAGDPTSPSALAKLEAAMAELRALKIGPYLDRAVDALKLGKAKEGGDWALKALELDECSGFAWRLLGIAREFSRDYGNAIRCYESALALTPDDVEIANDIGRLAYALDMKEQAKKLFAHFWRARPEMPDGANNLASVLRDLNECQQAIDVLKPSILAHPENPLLWNTLASTMAEMGDLSTALTFFDEALRLDPKFAKARYNRGNAKFALYDFAGSLEDCEAAMKDASSPAEKAMMRMARSANLLCLGRIAEGWDEYEARLDPDFAGVTTFAVDRPAWRPGQDLTGKTLLVMGEQGLGDEVLFANVLPDVIEDLGKDGAAIVAVEPRLVSLFQRSFPTARIGPHGTYKYETYILKAAPFADEMAADAWTPMGSLMRQYRTRVEAYPDRDRFLVADPERVAYWKAELAKVSDRPKVGLLWKSMMMGGARKKFFSPFAQWEPVLRTDGVTLVNLQYGDCSEEIAMAKEEFGVDIWNPPGIDLKQDLDDLAALSCAMDLVLGFSNATTNIAAACGAPVWMISGQNAWTRLGSERHPWYPQARIFDAPPDRDWSGQMSHIADELSRGF